MTQGRDIITVDINNTSSPDFQGSPTARRSKVGSSFGATHRHPRHDAAQVSAHGVQAVLLDGAVGGDDQVGGVTLQVKKANRVRGMVDLDCALPRHTQLQLNYTFLFSHLQALGQRAVTSQVGLQPLPGLDVVAQSVLSGLATAATARAVKRNNVDSYGSARLG